MRSYEGVYPIRPSLCQVEWVSVMGVTGTYVDLLCMQPKAVIPRGGHTSHTLFCIPHSPTLSSIQVYIMDYQHSQEW